jgi:DNA-binding Lrp family transcriptional regulator
MMVELRKAKAMQAIFVMIKCALGRAYTVAEKLADEVDEISEVHSISGQYDLLAKFYLPKDADIGHFVTEKVQTLDGVADTFTMITFKAFK